MFVRKADEKTCVIDEENGQEDGENHLLEKINYTRTCFMEQIAPLLEKRKTAGDLVRVLYDFIVKGKIQEKLCVYEKYFAENGERERAREYAQVYRLVMELLEQIVELLEKEPVTLKEFADILDAGFAEIEVGTIPGSVDRTLVGDMERSRLKQVKVLFFLGINDGNIPKGSMKALFLTWTENFYSSQSLS